MNTNESKMVTDIAYSCDKNTSFIINIPKGIKKLSFLYEFEDDFKTSIKTILIDSSIEYTITLKPKEQ